MEPSDYSVVRSDKWTLMRRIGDRNLSLVSDACGDTIRGIYQRICDRGYASERELFQDIYANYAGRSIMTALVR